jgi:uncharacterized protein with von Willebrand factor type A (vWA) domain
MESVFENSAGKENSDQSDPVNFWKNWKNIGEIREHSAETQWREQRSNQFIEIRILVSFTELSAEFTKKSPTFPKNRPGDSQMIFAETGRFF